MESASALPKRYDIGKTSFYKRRDYLMKLGYNLEPEQDGRKSLYTSEQIRLLDELDVHIQDTGSMEGFPVARVEPEKNPQESVNNSEETNSNGELVHRVGEQIEIDSAEDEEIYVDTNPLKDNELPRRKRTGYQNQKRLSCSS